MEGINVTKKEKGQVKKVYAFLKKISPALIGIAVIAAGVFIGCFISFYVFGGSSGYNSEDLSSSDYSSESETSSDQACSVIGINLHGTVVTYIPNHAEGDSFFDYDQTSSEEVTWSIEDANLDPDIKAILIEVDSGGGSPVAGEEIAKAVKASAKPVIAVIRDLGVSSAYWAISSADKIFASANSDVGSIGVTMSYVSNVEKNKKEGLIYEQISSGEFKDSGNPDKALTAGEKALFMRDINIIYNNFIKSVSENRGLTMAAVKSFADSSSVLGEKAKELGLIDKIGGIEEAKAYLNEVTDGEPVICW
jgi:protease-4